MNGGKIEQAGSAREIFNSPRTEFVARFIGGHNVLQHGGSTIAVRADRIAVARQAGDSPDSLEASVRDVEYLGTTVNIALSSDRAGDITATLPDSTFFQQPIEIGDTVFLSWSTADAHTLAA